MPQVSHRARLIKDSMDAIAELEQAEFKLASILFHSDTESEAVRVARRGAILCTY